jgi:hypothetical protein
MAGEWRKVLAGMTCTRLTGARLNCPGSIAILLPLWEISAKVVREKALRHGQMLTLHFWWT